MTSPQVRKGVACERVTETELKPRCEVLVKMEKGADFLCISPDGKGKFVESKSGRSGLTPYQREFKRKAEAAGFHYEIFRCE